VPDISRSTVSVLTLLRYFGILFSNNFVINLLPSVTSKEFQKCSAFPKVMDKSTVAHFWFTVGIGPVFEQLLYIDICYAVSLVTDLHCYIFLTLDVFLFIFCSVEQRVVEVIFFTVKIIISYSYLLQITHPFRPKSVEEILIVHFYVFTTRQCFLDCPSVRSFIRTDLVVRLSHKWLEQSQ